MFFKEKYSLAKYGDEFSNSYIMLKLLDRNQIMKYAKKVASLDKKTDSDNTEEVLVSSDAILEEMYALIKSSFISGRIRDGEEDRDMKKEDIDSFPIKVASDIGSVLQGRDPSKKA